MHGFEHLGKKPERVVVIGAGVSGLGFATEALRRRPDLELTVLESGARVGGLVRTDEPMPGVRVELGPDSFSRLAGTTDAMLEELALKDDVVEGGMAPRRAFLGREGHLEPIPASLMGAGASASELATSRLLSASAKLRMALEPFVSARRSTTPESAADFVRRRFGRGFLEQALGPLLESIYGAPAAELGAEEVLSRFVAMEREHGSVARGLGAPSRGTKPAVMGVISLREGMEQLPRALAARLGDRVKLEVSVVRIERLGRVYRLTMRDGSTLEADAVVISTPAAVAARLLDGLCPDASHDLASVASKSVETVSLLYEHADAPRALAGTGFVLPSGAARVLDAMSWANRKWSGRAPLRFDLLRCAIHGHHRDDREVLEDLHEDLRTWLGASVRPVATFIDRGRVSLPLLGIGHTSRMSHMRDCLDARPGLFVIGNGVDGLGVSECIRMGRALGASLAA